MDCNNSLSALAMLPAYLVAESEVAGEANKFPIKLCQSAECSLQISPTLKNGRQGGNFDPRIFVVGKNGCCHDYCDAGVCMRALTFLSIQQKGVVQLGSCRETNLFQE